MKRPDLSGSDLAPRCSDGVHFFFFFFLFYNRDDNERFGQRGADVSFLPNEAPDNRARIKRPL